MENTGSKKKNKILVCISSSKPNATVIQAAASMANAFDLKLIGIYVESTRYLAKDDIYQDSLKANLRLLESLGGTVVTVYGEDIPLQISEYAMANDIKKIVIGRSKEKKGLRRKKLYVDSLLSHYNQFELYSIPDNRLESIKLQTYHKNYMLNTRDILKSIVIIIGASMIGWLFTLAGFNDSTIITVYIMAVLFTSLWTNGRIYGVVSSLTNVILFNLFFTEPKYSLLAYDNGYPITFLIMLLSSFITSSLALKVKIQAREAAKKAYRTEVLLETSRILQSLETYEEIMKATAQQIKKLTKTRVLYYEVQNSKLGTSKLIHEQDVEEIIFERNRIDSIRNREKFFEKIILDSHERKRQGIQGGIYVSKEYEEVDDRIANWVFENNRMAGYSTGTYDESKYLYISIRGLELKSLGVITVYCGALKELDLFTKNIMFAILNESGTMIEHHLFTLEKKRMELKASQESLRANLLRSISHDLRTPLTNILGSSSILRNKTIRLAQEKYDELYGGIYEDARWLTQVVENILAVTKVENGIMGLKQEIEVVEDVIVEAMSHLDKRAEHRNITYELESEYLMAKMDVSLIIQVIINLVNNGVKYSEEPSPIKITVNKRNTSLMIGVWDQGFGLSKDEKEKIFQMFYTINKSQGDERRGLGLGLFLCKSIIEAHGGQLWVEDNVPKGSVFYFTLEEGEVSVSA